MESVEDRDSSDEKDSTEENFIKIVNLIKAAIHDEVDLNINRNQYITQETLTQRLYRKIFIVTGIKPMENEKTCLFEKWHCEILTAYNKLRSSLSHDEKANVERVLSKDCPHPFELQKFATTWYKYNSTEACKWFAVDGILGTHPKLYVQEAFSPHFAKHNDAVRLLYTYYSAPEKIKEVVETAFLANENKSLPEEMDPDFERCVGIYAEEVGEEEMTLIATERRAKLNQQQQPNKRKKVFTPSSP